MNEINNEKEIETILTAMGLDLVELKVQNVKGGIKFIIFMHKKDGGVSSDDCDNASRALIGRLESLFNNQDVIMEVSSPGINRIFKSIKEYKIFEGKIVEAFLSTGKSVKGVLEGSDGTTATIGGVKVNFSDVTKCRLV